jgi:pimeloyl-ACP methyl ester carboxylesterase
VWDHELRALQTRIHTQVAELGLLDSLPSMARQVLASATGPLLLAGHSMGGRVALEATRLSPARIVGLALLDTGVNPLPAGEAGLRERDERLRLLDIARQQGMRAMARDWVQRMVHPSRLNDHHLVGTIVEMLARRSPEHLEAQTQALLNRPDANCVLQEVQCPAVVMCGAQDLQAPPAQHHAMHERIAGSRLEVLAECGHMAPMEQPAEVSRVLLEWVDSATA